MEKLNIHVNYGDSKLANNINNIVNKSNEIIDEISIKNMYEQVALHVTTYDGLGVVAGLNILITDVTTEETFYKTLDANGECVFKIPIEDVYKITIPPLSGYKTISEQTFIACIENRPMLFVFQHLDEQYESVVCHFTVFNSTMVDKTTSDTGLIGTPITCELSNGTTLTSLIDSNHYCYFSVPYDLTYTITLPNVAGYMKIHQTTFTYTAGIPQKNIAFYYREWVNVGIYGMTDNGAMYTYEAMVNMPSSELANIHYISINTSRLQAANAGFFYKLPKTSTSQSWAGSNVEFDQSLLPFKQSHAVAVLDLDGKTNTANIIAIGDSRSISTNAADYCYAQIATIDGVEKHGFLGSFGQMYALSENILEINAIHTLLGIALPGFTSGSWLTSTQFNATNAVKLNNGAFGSNGKTNSFTTVALFAL